MASGEQNVLDMLEYFFKPWMTLIHCPCLLPPFLSNLKGMIKNLHNYSQCHWCGGIFSCFVVVVVEKELFWTTNNNYFITYNTQICLCIWSNVRSFSTIFLAKILKWNNIWVGKLYFQEVKASYFTRVTNHFFSVYINLLTGS